MLKTLERSVALKIVIMSEVGGSLLSRMVKQMVDERFVEL